MTGSMPPERAVAERLNIKRRCCAGRWNPRAPRPSWSRPGRAGAPRRASAGRQPGQVDQSHRGDGAAHGAGAGASRLAALRPRRPRSSDPAAATTPPAPAPAPPPGLPLRQWRSARATAWPSALYVLLHQVATDGRLRFADSDSATSPTRILARDQEHKAIADAIAARDPETAERAMWEASPWSSARS